MCAYAPISKKMFGYPRVRVWLKLHCFRTLIWSMCGFNHHIATPAACTTKRLNRVHLRVLRGITDCINGVSEARMSATRQCAGWWPSPASIA